MIKDSKRIFLQSYGWSEFFEAQLKEISDDHEIARVIGAERDWFRLQANEDQNFLAQVAGKLRLESGNSAQNWPAVGDWVTYKKSALDGPGIISQVLNRKTCLKRKVAGERIDAQIIAANFDTLFIATSLNQDLNLRRLERYLTLAWDSGAEPVILLTKSDLETNANVVQQKIETQVIGVKIFSVSIKAPETFDSIGSFLTPGKTVAIVGSSGVGKSTLVNALIGKELLATKETRDHDARGKHTTTSRHLLKTKMGGLILDTPGMREIQFLDQEEGLGKQFEDIEALFHQCRFTDCQHETEPGCALRTALESGEIFEEKWNSYQKLLGEMRHHKRKTDKAFASEEKKKWKKLHKGAYQMMELKKKST